METDTTERDHDLTDELRIEDVFTNGDFSADPPF